MNAEQAIELSPQGSGLIIVDMQAEGCERHGGTVQPVIRNIRALLIAFARAMGRSSTFNRCEPRTIPNSPSSAKCIR
jgi:nicotinamidase-related amidase